MEKPWYKKTKVVIGLIASFLQLLTVLLPILLTDDVTKILAVIGALTPFIMLTAKLLIDGHANTDMAFLEMKGKQALADAMLKTGGALDPLPPGSGRA